MVPWDAFDAREPAVAWNPASGEYLVAWSGTDLNANAFPWQIFGQRVSGSGTEIGTDVLLGSSGDEGYTPAVTANLDEQEGPSWSGWVTTVSNGSKLKVSVGPSLPGKANYTFRLDVRRDGACYRYLKQYRTKGTAETRTVNVPKGTYRARCYGPGFPQVTGTEAGDTVSRTVKVRR